MAISLKGLKAGHWGMVACCAIMLVPVGGYLLSGAPGGPGALLGSLLPLALCLGAHALMFKMLGTSCHPKSKEVEPAEATETGPASGRAVASLRSTTANRAA